MSKAQLRPLLLLSTILGLGIFATGCINISSMQTARTTPKGKAEIIVGGGLYTLKVDDDDNDNVGGFITVPGLEARGRYGITEELDAGLRLTLIGTAGLDVKYQFLDLEQVAVAVGGDVGYVSFSTGEGANETSFTTVDFTLPVYVSFHPMEWLSLYGVPKYVYRYIRVDGSTANNEGSADGSGSLVGASGGIKLGSDIGVIAEYSYAVLLEEDRLSFSQLNGAFFVQF